MASDLLESYIQQFSHNTAEIVSTTTKIPTLYGSKAIIDVSLLFSLKCTFKLLPKRCP